MVGCKIAHIFGGIPVFEYFEADSVYRNYSDAMHDSFNFDVSVFHVYSKWLANLFSLMCLKTFPNSVTVRLIRK